MSYIKNKGKKLTTKRKNNKKTSEECARKQNCVSNSSLFDSFVSVRNSKTQKDATLLFENSSNSPTAGDNETDIFKFSYKTNTRRFSSEDKIFFETTVLQSPHEEVFKEETKTETSTSSSCSKLKTGEQFDHDESSLLFECKYKDSKNSESLPLPEENGSKKNDVSLNDLVPIPSSTHLNPTIADSVSKDSTPDQNEDSESDVQNQCPVCLKTISTSKYLSHIKSCAAKNKLSTQQLLSALRLQKKQLAERKELGLGVPVQSYRAKVSPKRSRTDERKGPVDSSLQLALALSASLHSAQEDEVIQEAEALKEAGLCEEAEQKLSTLEQFGFARALPTQTRGVAGASKSRPLLPSLLLRRTQEERERIVTEKVAIVLISEEESVNHAAYSLENPVLKSKVLKEKWDKEYQLWSKSCCSGDEKRDTFYVKSLSQFVSPSKAEVGEGLRRLSQLPGRINTPLTHQTKGDGDNDLSSPFESFVEMEEVSLSEMPTPPRKIVPEQNKSLSKLENSDISELPTPFRSDVNGRGKGCDSINTLSSLSDDWRKLVNNEALSDLKIKCEGCMFIPAHKLVLYVRCPKILEEVIKLSSEEAVIDWGMVSVSSVLAFLEFVYCGKVGKVLSLDANDYLDIRSIADRLDFTELKTRLNGTKSSLSELKNKGIKKNLFQSDRTSYSDDEVEHIEDKQRGKTSSFSQFEKRSDIEKMSTSPAISLEVSYSGRGSPDMFGDSCITGNIKSPSDRDDLDILVSLIGKPTQYKDGSNKPINRQEERGTIEIDSPSGSSTSEFTSGKRKMSILSLSDEENSSVSKKHCSYLPRGECSESSSKGETFDLTQSSDTSNEEIVEKSSEERVLDVPENTVPLNKKREEELDLTQSKFSDGGDFQRSKCASNRLEKSHKDDSLVDLTQSNINEITSEKCATTPTLNEDIVNPIWDMFDHNDIYDIESPKSAGGRSRDYTKLSTSLSPHRGTSNAFSVSSNCLHSSKKIHSHEISPSSNISRKDEALLEGNNTQDFIDPVWEGFDDYYHYQSYSPSLKTPMKYQDDSLKKNSSYNIGKSSVSPPHSHDSNQKPPRKLTQTVLSPLNRSPKSIKSISSDSKSPTQKSQKSLTPGSSSSIRFLSSDSKSPKVLSQRVLTDFSPLLDRSYEKKSLNSSVDDSDIKLNPRISNSQPCPLKTDLTKSRKNLSFQFEARSNSSQRTAEQLSPNQQSNPSKSSLRKDSLAAMQRLLDDSFEINDSLFDSAEVLASGKHEKEHEVSKQCPEEDCIIPDESGSKVICSEQDHTVAGTSRSKTTIDTPSPGIIVSDKVTPLPDYSGMKTPALKKELSRFGLKPSLGRQKAKLLLRYIYDETHPVVPTSEGGTSEFKLPEGRPPKSPVKSPRMTVPSKVSPRKAKSSVDSGETLTTVNLDDSESESDDHCSQMSTSSSISSGVSLPEESYHEADEILTQDLADSGDVRSRIRSLITGNPELHRMVLMYEPIYLENLVAMLKANGLKCNNNLVMDYLDEQCITFRTNSWKVTNEKRKQKQKSPKKKTKSQKPDSSSSSPSKIEAQVKKKRGRPRKTES